MRYFDAACLVLITLAWPCLITTLYCLMMRDAPWWLLLLGSPLVGIAAGVGMVRTVRALGLW